MAVTPAARPMTVASAAPLAPIPGTSRNIQNDVENIHACSNQHRLPGHTVAAKNDTHGAEHGLQEQENADKSQVLGRVFKHILSGTDKIQHRSAEEKYQQADHDARDQMQQQRQRSRPGRVFLLTRSEILGNQDTA